MGLLRISKALCTFLVIAVIVSHVTVAEAIHFIDVRLPRAGKVAKSKIWSSNSNNSRTRWSPGLSSPQTGTCMTRDAPSTGEMTFETTSRACPNCKLQEILHEALKTHAMRSNLLLSFVDNHLYTSPYHRIFYFGDHLDSIYDRIGGETCLDEAIESSQEDLRDQEVHLGNLLLVVRKMFFGHIRETRPRGLALRGITLPAHLEICSFTMDHFFLNKRADRKYRTPEAKLMFKRAVLIRNLSSQGALIKAEDYQTLIACVLGMDQAFRQFSGVVNVESSLAHLLRLYSKGFGTWKTWSSRLRNAWSPELSYRLSVIPDQNKHGKDEVARRFLRAEKAVKDHHGQQFSEHWRAHSRDLPMLPR